MRCRLGLLLTMGLVLLAASQAGAVTDQVTVNITTTADNYFALYVDGNLVNYQGVGDFWTSPRSYSLTLDPGPHAIGIKAWNYEPGAVPTESNPAAVLFQMTDGNRLRNIPGHEGENNKIVSDGSWQALAWNSNLGEKQSDVLPTADWAKAQDSSGFTWQSATAIAPYGQDIWGGRAGSAIGQDAWWIWTANNGCTNASTTGDSTVYLRTTFSVAPVPEPVTFLTGLLVLSGLGAYMRRRTRVAAKA